MTPKIPTRDFVNMGFNIKNHAEPVIHGSELLPSSIINRVDQIKSVRTKTIRRIVYVNLTDFLHNFNKISPKLVP